MGYVPTDYDKYFDFNLVDFSRFDINIEPPTPPPLPPSDNSRNNQVRAAQSQEIQSESLTEEIHSEISQISSQEFQTDINRNLPQELENEINQESQREINQNSSHESQNQEIEVQSNQADQIQKSESQNSENNCEKFENLTQANLTENFEKSSELNSVKNTENSIEINSTKNSEKLNEKNSVKNFENLAQINHVENAEKLTKIISTKINQNSTINSEKLTEINQAKIFESSTTINSIKTPENPNENNPTKNLKKLANICENTQEICKNFLKNFDNSQLISPSCSKNSESFAEHCKKLAQDCEKLAEFCKKTSESKDLLENSTNFGDFNLKTSQIDVKFKSESEEKFEKKILDEKLENSSKSEENVLKICENNSLNIFDKSCEENLRKSNKNNSKNQNFIKIPTSSFKREKSADIEVNFNFDIVTYSIDGSKMKEKVNEKLSIEADVKEIECENVAENEIESHQGLKGDENCEILDFKRAGNLSEIDGNLKIEKLENVENNQSENTEDILRNLEGLPDFQDSIQGEIKVDKSVGNSQQITTKNDSEITTEEPEIESMSDFDHIPMEVRETS